MSATHTATLSDYEDSLGLGFADVEYRLHCTVFPGPSGRLAVDIDEIEIVAVRPQDGTALTRPLTAADLNRLRTWVDNKTGENWPEIERQILELEDAPPTDCPPDDFDGPDFDDEAAYRDCGWGTNESYGCLGDET